MGRKRLIQQRFLGFLLTFFSLTSVFAQVKPSDSASVRQDFSLPNPTRYEAFYDVSSGMYILYPKIGNIVVGNPVSMTSAEYQKYMLTNEISEYYREKSSINDLGYRIITGNVIRIGESRSAIWINLAKNLALRIIKEDLPHFPDDTLKNLMGKNISARGWLYFANGQFRMQIRHPVDIRIKDH